MKRISLFCISCGVLLAIALAADTAIAATSGSVYVINATNWSQKIHAGDVVGVQIHNFGTNNNYWSISKKIKGGSVKVAGEGIEFKNAECAYTLNGIEDDSCYRVAPFVHNQTPAYNYSYAALPTNGSWVSNYSLVKVPSGWVGSNFSIEVNGKTSVFQVVK